MGNVNYFYKNIIKNLNSKKIFIHSKKKKYNYIDIKKFYFSFCSKLKIFETNKKQLKICTLSKKSFFLYSSIISIILSRNIWVPIDEEMPLNIISYIIKKSKVDLVLVDSRNEKLFSKFLNKIDVSYINIEKFNLRVAIKNQLNFKDYKEEDLAMIFFTSGSTGYPKGVKMTNNNFISSLRGQMRNIFSNINCKNLIFGDYHNTSFVISLNILLPCLLLCSRISPAKDPNDRINPLPHIRENKVNCLITLPSTIDRIKSFNNNFNNLKIRALLMCGEPFYIDNLYFIKDNIKPDQLFNCYGSTELSPWVFSYKFIVKDLNKIKKQGIVPIGKKFFNVKYKIVNDELRINGEMVNNYLDISQNSANHLKKKQSTWFLTKDKVKKIGKLIYVIGRSDSVVKLRGYRIELRGIESKIREFKDISNCFVFLSTDRNKKIFAAVETKNKKIRYDLEYFLSKNLQSYMIPKKIMFYTSFPKNKNGKTDRFKIKNKFKVKNL